MAQPPLLIEAILSRRFEATTTPVRRPGDALSVIELLAAGASVSAVDGAGNTALHLALKHDAPVPVVQALLAAGADAFAPNKAGLTPAEMPVPARAKELRKLVLMHAAKEEARRSGITLAWVARPDVAHSSGYEEYVLVNALLAGDLQRANAVFMGALARAGSTRVHSTMH